MPHEPTDRERLIDALQAAAPLADRIGVTAVQQARDAAALKAAVARAVAIIREQQGRE